MWNTIAQDNCNETAMDCLSFSNGGRRSSSGASIGSQKPLRRLNLFEPLSFQQMVCDNDDMSFYDDEASALLEDNNQGQQHEFDDLASLDDDVMLLPEQSSIRFSIVDISSNDKINPTNCPTQNPIRNRQNAIASNSSEATKTFRAFNSLSSESMESSIDDEDYMELFEMESLEEQHHQNQQLREQNGFNSMESTFKFPSNLSSLFSGRIQNSSSPQTSASKRNSSGKKQQTPMKQIKTPEMRRPAARRCLSMTENNYQQKSPDFLGKISLQNDCRNNLNERLNGSYSLLNNCFKRPDPPSLPCSPVQSKRYRFHEKENLNDSFSRLSASATATSPSPITASIPALPLKSNHPPLRKSMSMNDAEIMSALARFDSKDEPELIGDFSRPFVLPTMEGRHRDLKSISSDTVARLLKGDFNDKVASYQIIDCRYPYEFEGGHIRGAKNLYTQEQIIDEFLTKQKTEEKRMASSNLENNKRNIIIFHCEFSSERGPKLSRFLRNNDRVRNTNSYPALDYPEIYLLHNGYKEFFETHAELCDPISYRPMLEPGYNEAYRHFRAKSKSWNGDGLGGGTTRMKKSRSRLLL